MQGSMPKRPIGFIAYLSMSYSLAALTDTWLDGARLGFIVYSIFDFTSSYMWHGCAFALCNPSARVLTQACRTQCSLPCF